MALPVACAQLKTAWTTGATVEGRGRSNRRRQDRAEHIRKSVYHGVPNIEMESAPRSAGCVQLNLGGFGCTR